jgi:hypothetical protein
MNKYFKEVITKNALEVKLESSLFVDLNIDQSPELKAQFKNVCAPISLQLNEELEKVTGRLGLSKRYFLTMAIASAIDDAKTLMEEIDIDEYLCEALEAKAKHEADEQEAWIEHNKNLSEVA